VHWSQRRKDLRVHVRDRLPAHRARGGEQVGESFMESYFLEWANLLLRWVHVITAIAWIGSSF
jgi:hypothetical protein